MTTATAADYRLEVNGNANDHRIVAVTADTDVEIAGAYRPAGLNDWRVYVTKLVSDATGLPQPHKMHVCTRDEAVRWVDTVAWLYVQAVAA